MKNLIDSRLGMGRLIRQKIIPNGMSVTEAAKRLGVSRPALSKLLNGRVALSPKMALRLEETFGADMKELLNIQATSESESQRDKHRTVPVGRYVPDFLTITARQIETWNSIEARNLLPVLVRRLIHATGRELQQVDFPGFDNAQRHGFDGQVLAGAEALNVPAGHSVWEVSVEQPPQRKAERDYQGRVRQLTQAERAEHTFVFVTTQNWRGKDEWVKKKNELGEWKEVRAYDASDLEQWLEITVAPRIWLAEKLSIPTDDFRTIEACWDEWMLATEPPLTPAIFAPSIGRHRNDLQRWLESPPDRPFIVTADSHEEATAFIACFLREEELSAISGSAVVFESVDILKLLSRSTSPFIAVVCDEEIERSIGDVFRRRHCIVVRPRNTPFGKPDIAVDPLDREAFENTLSDMGIERQRFERLARQSGLSPTILRRRLAKVPAIQTPPWAKARKIARNLIPMALVGAWNAGFDADREILETLADNTYDNVESAIAELRQIVDCPIWCIGKHRGVVSKIDAIFAIAPLMVERDLTNFIDMAEYVLSETDPALDLPENSRLLAGFFGKVREHSAALRSSVRDTLTFLAVHGNELFLTRLGVDVKAQVSALVNRLLSPLTSKKLESFNHDLPDFAEAAPRVFLRILQEDLQQPEPVLRSLLRPAGGHIFSSPPRTGLLWALERLAWHREHHMDVVNILAELSCTRIDDNWVNKPAKSLASIFHSWLPQTAVSVEDRIEALNELCRRFPDTGWQVCIRQINGSNRIGESSNRPRWRTVAAESMTPVSKSERSKFERAALDMIVNWPIHNVRTLCDLLPCLPRRSEEEQLNVLDRVSTWVQPESDDSEKAKIREQLGRLLFNVSGYPSSLYTKAFVQAREIFGKLIPEDSFERHALLFSDYKAYYFIAQAEDPTLDGADWLTRHHAICKQAMTEIWYSCGIDGVLALLHENNAGFTIGRYAASHARNPQLAADAVRTCLSTDTLSHEKINDFMRGFFEVLGDDTSAEVLSSLVPTIADDNFVRVFRCARFTVPIWHLLDQLPEHVRDQCWKNANVLMKEYSSDESRKLVDNLLRVDRPWDAFEALRADWDRVETSALKRLLQGVTERGLDQINYSGDAAYFMPKALASLAKRPGVSVDEMAQLEFASIEWVHPSECRIPSLEKQIEISPSAFVFFLSLVTKRRAAGQDPAEWQVGDPVLQRILAGRAQCVFEVLRRLPGVNDNGEVNLDILSRWIAEARRLSKEHGRLGICDQQIGQWLSRASSQEDTRWPSRPICEVLESIASNEIASGFRMGVYNARGSTSRGSYEGGRQERDLAARYRLCAEAWRSEYRFVSKIIDEIATNYENKATREDSEAEVRRRRDL